MKNYNESMSANDDEDVLYFRRLMRAVVGNGSGEDKSKSDRPTPTIHKESIARNPDDGEWHSPASFHQELCNRIRDAKERVLIASLYVGAGVDPNAKKEKEFLNEIENASHRVPDVKIVMDANRGLRPVQRNNETSLTSTSYARELSKRVTSTQNIEKSDSIGNLDKSSSGLYLFDVLSVSPILSSVLPSPINEIAGVFHLKAYVIDNCLILSGANLSEEYFVDRQDRFVVLVNGAGGLVDFYARLINCFCDRSSKFSIDEHGKDILAKTSVSIEAFIKTLDFIFQSTSKEVIDDIFVECDTVAYIVPTLQLPKSFLIKKQPSFKSGTDTIKSFLTSAISSSHASIRMATAYINPTPSFLPLVTNFGCLESRCGQTFILAPSEQSHGFTPKKGKDNGQGRDWIPNAFSQIAYDVSAGIKRGGVLYWYRPSWTFHSKGIWITSCQKCHDKQDNRTDYYCDPHLLRATILGSSNFGQRSEKLDVESNAIIIMNPLLQNTGPKGLNFSVKRAFANDWNQLTKYAISQNTMHSSSIMIKFILPIVRKLM